MADPLQTIAKHTLTPLLKPYGFTKKRHAYHCRKNDVIQVVELQKRQAVEYFFVNVGFAFDFMCELHEIPITETPIASSCMLHARGVYYRLEELTIETTEYQWPIDNFYKDEQKFSKTIINVVERISTIDSLTSALNNEWFMNELAGYEFAALAHYSLGDYSKAYESAVNYCEVRNANRDKRFPPSSVEKLITRHNLTQLNTYLAMQN